MLALRYAQGWYYDNIEIDPWVCEETGQMAQRWAPRYKGWQRVLSLENGSITFHIPDDFDVGNLPQIGIPNWDGHTTEQKWARIAERFGIEIG